MHRAPAVRCVQTGALHRRRAGSAQPEHGPGRVAWLLLYPDTYEIGLPNQGLQILYEILNERPDALAERAYAPWVDMEAAMRAAGVPLFSVEQHLPAAAFDVLAFNLSAELVYTNVVNLIDLAGLPLHAADRAWPRRAGDRGRPLRVQPRATGRLRRRLRAWRRRGGGQRAERGDGGVARFGRARRAPTATRCRASLAQLEGVYVPALYTPRYEGGRLVATRPRPAHRPRWSSARWSDLADWPYPSRPLVPLTEVVHDRLNVEVFRGCTRGCRFCQAGMITRPVRERPAAQVRDMVRRGLEWSGHDEVALTSLSTADFSGIEDTVRDIVDDPAYDGRVSVSLPSLRVDAFTVGTAAEIQKVRRTGLTFAPEGGTWRMRTVINKLITEEDLYGAVDAAFSQGWRRVKLYFLIGLPTELDEDVLGIAQLRRALRRDRAPLQQVGHRRGLRRRFRAEGPHTLPVVRHGHGRRVGAQGRTPAGRGEGRRGASPSAGTSRALRSPRGWPAAATAAWAR